jgi:hypothetical protein
MKINIIANTFQNYHRQNVAVDSWRYLKQLFPDNVEVYNFQFADEEESYLNHYPDLTTKFVLSNSQEEVKGAHKKLPFMSEMFSFASELEGDYFIITNSDVIIMPKLIEYIINEQPKALPCSRLDIQNIDHFNRVPAQQIVPVRYEIAGFDTFVFEKEWAVANKRLFSDKFLMGKFLYDVIWAGYMKIYGDNQPLGNGFPPYCFHIHHGIDAVVIDCPERDWNLALAKGNDLNILMCNAMVLNLTQNLMRRTPYGAFMQQMPNERVLEKALFDCLNIHRNLT